MAKQNFNPSEEGFLVVKWGRVEDYQSFEFWILEAQEGGGLFQVAVDKGFGIHRLFASWLKLINNEEITILARE